MSALDHSALNRLYSEHNSWLKGWLRVRLGNAADASDLAQDTFMRVLTQRKAPELREPRAYLSTVARSLMIDMFRRRALEQAYLEYLYTEEAQDLIGKHFYRPRSEKAQAKYARQLPRLNLFTIDQAFGGWDKADKAHFADGASFDQIYAKK